MAKATGITVGKVVSISESQSYNPPMYGNQMMKASMVADGGREGGTISAGQLEISTTISINYEIR